MQAKTSKSQYFWLGITLFLFLFLYGCRKVDVAQPIAGFKFGDIFVYPMAGLMWVLAKSIAFKSYAATIILATIIVRSIAWPIYTKTNDLSLKMELAQPELEKIKEKYEGKENDPVAKQQMQMETMRVYKKYKIGIGGCLLPFLQFPIFIGFFRTIGRMPASIASMTDGKLDIPVQLLQNEGPARWIQVFKSVQMGDLNLLLKMNENPSVAMQKWGVIILAILVGITQLVSMGISIYNQKRQEKQRLSDIPEYRRPKKDEKAKMQSKMMLGFQIVMAGFMVMFVLQSPAALGLYWLVGNVFSTGQMIISTVWRERRKAKLREKF